MPFGMLRIRWSDIVLMSYLSTEGKNWLLNDTLYQELGQESFHFLSSIRKFLLKNVMQNWKEEGV